MVTDTVDDNGELVRSPPTIVRRYVSTSSRSSICVVTILARVGLPKANTSTVNLKEGNEMLWLLLSRTPEYANHKEMFLIQNHRAHTTGFA